LEEGAQPPFGSIYNLLEDELSALIIHWQESWERVHSTFQISKWCSNPIC
jgi:hypothetical protein